MKFRPLHDRVVDKRIEAEDKTTGGIIIPDTAKEKPSQGEIVAVGPGGRDGAGRVIRSTSRSVTGCCSANGRAPRCKRQRLPCPAAGWTSNPGASSLSDWALNLARSANVSGR